MDSKETRIYFSIVFGIVLIIFILIYFIVWQVKLHRVYRYKMEKLLERELDMCVQLRIGIVRDVHDDVGAHLTSISYSIQLLKVAENEGTNKKEISLQLSNLMARTRALPTFPTNSRALMHDLHKFINDIHTKGIRIELVDEGMPEFSEEQSVQVSLLLREIIHNTIRHSGAGSLTIALMEREGTACIKTVDDGKGFNKYTTAKKRNAGIGIESIMVRAQQLGGTALLNSRPGAGVTYFIQFPLRTKLDAHGNKKTTDNNSG